MDKTFCADKDDSLLVQYWCCLVYQSQVTVTSYSIGLKWPSELGSRRKQCLNNLNANYPLRHGFAKT